jgi:hypothetical protein
VREGVVGNRCDKAGDCGDLVPAGGEAGDDKAEMFFGERTRGIDVESAAEVVERAMMNGVRLLRVESKGEADVEVYEGSI